MNKRLVTIQIDAHDSHEVLIGPNQTSGQSDIDAPGPLVLNFAPINM